MGPIINKETTLLHIFSIPELKRSLCISETNQDDSHYMMCAKSHTK